MKLSKTLSSLFVLGVVGAASASFAGEPKNFASALKIEGPQAKEIYQTVLKDIDKEYVEIDSPVNPSKRLSYYQKVGKNITCIHSPEHIWAEYRCEIPSGALITVTPDGVVAAVVNTEPPQP